MKTAGGSMDAGLLWGRAAEQEGRGPGSRFCFPQPRLGTPGGSAGKESACSGEDPVSIPGLGRSPGEENSNPLQYSCWENPMDGGA